MQRITIAEYDTIMRKWTSRYKDTGNPSLDYLDYVMRNKWTPGPNYSRAVYRVSTPDCRRYYYHNGERIDLLKYLELTGDVSC
jgi:hypothetical protein